MKLPIANTSITKLYILPTDLARGKHHCFILPLLSVMSRCTIYLAKSNGGFSRSFLKHYSFAASINGNKGNDSGIAVVISIMRVEASKKASRKGLIFLVELNIAKK